MDQMAERLEPDYDSWCRRNGNRCTCGSRIVKVASWTFDGDSIWILRCAQTGARLGEPIDRFPNPEFAEHETVGTIKR